MYHIKFFVIAQEEETVPNQIVVYAEFGQPPTKTPTKILEPHHIVAINQSRRSVHRLHQLVRGPALDKLEELITTIQGQPIFLSICSNIHEALSWPWPKMRLRRFGLPLARLANVALGFELLDGAGPHPDRLTSGRILLCWAAGRAPVPLTHHAQAISQALAEVESSTPIEFVPTRDIVGPVSPGLFLREVSRKSAPPPIIIHILCHGVENGKFLEWVSDDMTSLRVSSQDIASWLLGSRRKVRLAVLHACSSGGSPNQNTQNSIALSLHRIGIPWVIGTHGLVAKSATCVFSQHFYSALFTDDAPVEVAFLRATSAVGVAHYDRMGDFRMFCHQQTFGLALPLIQLSKRRQIFVGCDSPLLAQHRRAILEVLRDSHYFRVVSLVGLGLSTTDWESECRRQIISADAVIICVGGTYGPTAAGKLRSQTHIQHQFASQARKPIFSFIKKLGAEWKGYGLVQHKTQMCALRDSVLQGTVDTFDGPIELAKQVKQVLENWLLMSGARAQSVGRRYAPQPFIVHPFPFDAKFVGRRQQRGSLTRWLDGPKPMCVVEAIGGRGKSALVWRWTQVDVLGIPLPGYTEENQDRLVPQSRPDGVFWWSFYELDARFSDFVRELLIYITGQPPRQSGLQAVHRLLDILCERRILLVMDGFERELLSYVTGYNPSVGDDPPDGATSYARACADPHATSFLRFVSCVASAQCKILLTTRLMPSALEGQSRQPLPNVQRYRLGDMSHEDIHLLFSKFGIRASDAHINDIWRSFGGHPLLLRLLIGVILCDPLSEGEIEAISGYDPIPQLIGRRNHILQIAFDSLSEPTQQLLSVVAASRGPLDTEFLRLSESIAAANNGRKPRVGRYLLDAVVELQDRNLVMRSSRNGTIDLHPIVRKYSYERLLSANKTHLLLSRYLERYSTATIANARHELNPVIELFHHLVGAGAFDRALVVLHDRLFQPLMTKFNDLGAVLELFESLASAHGPFAPFDVERYLWFNQQFSPILRMSGLHGRGRRWRERVSAIDRASEKRFHNRNLVAEYFESQVEEVRTLRAMGDLAAAIELGRDAVSAPVADPRKAIIARELSVTLAAVGRFGEAKRWLRRVGTGSPHLSPTWSRSHAELAFYTSDFMIAAHWLQSASQSGWDMSSAAEAVEADILRVRVSLASIHYTGEADEILRRCRRMCGDFGFIDLLGRVQHAEAELALSNGDLETAELAAQSVVDLATRGDLRLLQADGLLTLAKVYKRAGSVRWAIHMAQAARNVAVSPLANNTYSLVQRECAKLLEDMKY